MSVMPEIWPPLLTPFTTEGAVDYDALEELVSFNIAQGVTGLLITGLSAEPFELSEAERNEILKRCVRVAEGQVEIAAAVYPESPQDYPRVIKAAHDAGAQIAVLLTGQLAEETASDAEVLASLEQIIAATKGNLGLYEAPRPFKRLLEDRAVALAAASGRFTFFKDTCLDLPRIARRAKLCTGSPLRLLNAEMASFRASMEVGARGFCGLMANIYPGQLRRAATDDDDTLSLLMTAADAGLEKNYPASAKLLLAVHDGLGLTSHARTLGRGTYQGECTSLFAADMLIRRSLAEKVG